MINQFRLRMAPSQAENFDHGLIGFEKERELFELINQFRLRMASFQVWKVDHRLLIYFEKEMNLFEKNYLKRIEGLMGQAAYGKVDWVMSGVMVTR